MKGNVLEGRILVKEILPEEVTVNGVIVPAVMQDQRTGEVVIGGEEMKVGDVFYFNSKKSNAVKLHIEDQDYLLMKEQGDYYIL